MVVDDSALLDTRRRHSLPSFGVVVVNGEGSTVDAVGLFEVATVEAPLTPSSAMSTSTMAAFMLRRLWASQDNRIKEERNLFDQTTK